MSDDIANQWSKFMEMWNTQSVGLADEVAAPNLVYHVPPFPDTDLAGLKAMVVEASKMSGFKVVSHEDIIRGDRSAHRWSASGTWSAPVGLLPGEPNGRTAQADGSHVCHWRDGFLVEAWHVGDWLGWYQTAGAQPKPQ